MAGLSQAKWWRRAYRLATLIALALIRLPTQARASERDEVPVSVEIPILLKVLTFDRARHSRDSTEFRIDAVYIEKLTDSRETAAQLRTAFAAMEGTTLGGAALRFRVIAWNGEAAFAGEIASRSPNAVYIAEGCAEILPEILAITRSRKIVSLAGTTVLVELGASIGVGRRDEKPEIVVNLAASREEGVDLSSQLLNLCRVFR